MESNTQLQKILAASPMITRYYDFLTRIRNYASGTARSYVLAIGDFKEWLLSISKDYRAVGYEDFVAYLGHMADRGLAHTTMCHHLYAVRNFYKWLSITFNLSIDRLMLVQGPKVEKNLPEVLTRQQIESLLAIIPTNRRSGIRDRAIFELMYYTGVRVSEVCDLRLFNLRLDEGFALINGKGSKQRVVMLAPRLVSLIRAWLDLRATLRVKHEARDYVFCDLISYDQVSRFTIARQVAKYGELAGIPCHVHPHMLRHTFATHMLDGGADLCSIKALMGHESISTTERYIHVSTAHLKAQVEQYHPHGSLHSKIS